MTKFHKQQALSFFGTLDLLNFILLIQLLRQLIKMPTTGLADSLFVFIQVALIVSFLVSGYFLLKGKLTGIKIYYVQFPLRLAFIFLTFGFIVYLNLFFNYYLLSRILIAIAILLEFMRLIVSVTIHIGKPIWKRN